MKRIAGFLFIVVIVAGLYGAWNVFGPVVSAPQGNYFYVHTGEDLSAVRHDLLTQKIIPNGFFFDLVSRKANYGNNVRPGRYEISANSSLVNLVRMLKNGKQAPVKLVINKLRTKEDLAALIGKNFETDSAQAIRFLLSRDSLSAFGLDSNTALTAVIPDTYSVLWNTPFKKIFARLHANEVRFWTPEREAKAAAKHLSKEQVYTLAGIVEEESNSKADKPLIASVYLNRLAKGQPLGADPTVKYAMRNFALKRVLQGHLKYDSPYNTYLHTGVPPGPIATATPASIDAVLDAPQTGYLYFVAKPDLKGGSNFAETYPQHLLYAHAYQKALDSIATVRAAAAHQ